MVISGILISGSVLGKMEQSIVQKQPQIFTERPLIKKNECIKKERRRANQNNSNSDANFGFHRICSAQSTAFVEIDANGSAK
jgi:hypothetical protein